MNKSSSHYQLWTSTRGCRNCSFSLVYRRIVLRKNQGTKKNIIIKFDLPLAEGYEEDIYSL